jgi:hypothetical protein
LQKPPSGGGTRTFSADSALAPAKQSSQHTLPDFQVFGRVRLGWLTISRMHVFRVGALRDTLVLAALAIACMGATPSSRSSGVVATPWAFAPTPTRRLKH